MRFELFLIAITAFIVGNVYTDGKWFAWAMSKKKYYQMALIIFGAAVLYWTFRGSASSAQNMARKTTELLRHLPLDAATSGLITPILDFTSRHGNLASELRSTINNPILSIDPPRLGGQGVHAEGYPPRVKRSVGETRKKIVASSQNWRCKHCTNQLTAFYEIDHVVALEEGGSNEASNLVALCRECHAKKTFSSHI